MPHDPLCDLWSDAGTGERSAERGPQGVEIDVAAFIVHWPDSRPFEVATPCGVRDRLGEDARRRYGWILAMPYCKRIGQLRVHRKHIDALGFPLTDGQGALTEVDIRPGQPCEITFAKSRERGGQIPRGASSRLCDSDQPREFIVGE